MRTITFFFTMLVCFGVSLLITIPTIPQDAMEYALSNVEPRGGVSEEDFKESMDRNILRFGNLYVQAPYGLIEPDNPYVVEIGQGIMEGCDNDYELATACLNWVQVNIEYAHDDEIYGCREFWATPTETLYLGAGDCEDTSVLLASLLLSVGLDAVLLEYVGHTAVGVYLDGEYRFCESTYDFEMPIGSGSYGYCVDKADIWRADGGNEFCSGWSSFMAGYRYIIRDVFGV